MAAVLTTSSDVKCGHGAGKVTVQSSTKLAVNGSRALIKSSIELKAVGMCSTAPSSDASGPIDVTCTSVTSVGAGEAAKLTAGGRPVVLETLKGTTNGLVTKTPQDKLTASPKQTKLTAR
jgi:hypothetical protein